MSWSSGWPDYSRVGKLKKTGVCERVCKKKENRSARLTWNCARRRETVRVVAAEEEQQTQNESSTLTCCFQAEALLPPTAAQTRPRISESALCEPKATDVSFRWVLPDFSFTVQFLSLLGSTLPCHIHREMLLVVIELNWATKQEKRRTLNRWHAFSLSSSISNRWGDS